MSGPWRDWPDGLTPPGDRDPGTATVFRVIRERFGYGAEADDLIRALLPNAEVPGDRDRREARVIEMLDYWLASLDVYDGIDWKAAFTAARALLAAPGQAGPRDE